MKLEYIKKDGKYKNGKRIFWYWEFIGKIDTPTHQWTYYILTPLGAFIIK